jgi:hypothetical protein
VVVAGLERRFCQQCSRWDALAFKMSAFSFYDIYFRISLFLHL